MVTHVTLCDSETLTRQALARALSDLTDIELVSEITNLRELAGVPLQRQTDIVIFSTSTFTEVVIDELLNFLSENGSVGAARVLVLVPTVEKQHLQLCVHGNCALLPRSVTFDAVAAALYMMHNGFLPIASTWMKNLKAIDASPKEQLSTTNPTKFGILSNRENEILSLLGDGLTNAEISERLYLATSTTKTYVKQVFRKLHVRNRTEAALLLRRTKTSFFLTT